MDRLISLLSALTVILTNIEKLSSSESILALVSVILIEVFLNTDK